MPLGQGYPLQDCAIARALEVVGDRWTLLVLRDCFLGVHRFADLVAHLDVPRAVLSDRLTRLVEAGILERDPAGYRVTAAATPLWPALRALAAWGESGQRAAGGTVRRFAHAGLPRRRAAGHRHRRALPRLRHGARARRPRRAPGGRAGRTAARRPRQPRPPRTAPDADAAALTRLTTPCLRPGGSARSSG